jgi:hypothetical protein
MSSFAVSDHPPVTFSPLVRKDSLDHVTVHVCIYQVGHSGWTLRIMNSRGLASTWQKKFATDQEALAEYDQHVQNSGLARVIESTSVLTGIDGFNPDLLEPQDQRYRGNGYKDYFVLRQFSLIKKYAGKWPIHNVYGHIITGYLYRNAAPAWPHAALHFPDAPPNIEVEFSVPSLHIESHIQHELGLQRACGTNYWER